MYDTVRACVCWCVRVCFHREIEVTVALEDFQGLQAHLDLLELRYGKYRFPLSVWSTCLFAVGGKSSTGCC